MRHRVAGRKLSRTSQHRTAMLRNMSTSLFQHERIRTTLQKAKELRSFAEKLLTLSRKESLHARRRVLRQIHDRAVVAKLFDTLAARYAQRPGGYTRILKLGPRRGDNAEMAIIELVGSELESTTPDAPKPKKKRAKKAASSGTDKRPARPAREKQTVKRGSSAKAGAPRKQAPQKKSEKT